MLFMVFVPFIYQGQETLPERVNEIISLVKEQISKVMPKERYEVDLKKAAMSHQVEMEKIQFEKDKFSLEVAERLTVRPFDTINFIEAVRDKRYEEHLETEKNVFGYSGRLRKQLARLKADIDVMETKKQLDDLQAKNAEIIFSRGESLLRSNNDLKMLELKKLLNSVLGDLDKEK